MAHEPKASEDVEMAPRAFPEDGGSGCAIDMGEAGKPACEACAAEGDPGGVTGIARELCAELVGTMIIVLVGCGAVCCSVTGVFQGIVQMALVWGCGVALAIFCTAEVSGAHLNPAVTLAFWLVRPSAHSMNARRAALFMVAQLCGGVLGGAVNLCLYDGTLRAFERAQGIVRGEAKSILTACAFGEYFPNPGLSAEFGSGPYRQDDVSVAQALMTEAWGTAVLCFVIFSITHSKNRVLEVQGSRPSVPVAIGATIVVLLALYAPITQAGWNPARDFGPRLVAAGAGWGSVAIPGPRQGFWIYIAGPCLGGPLGAAAAEFVVFGDLLDRIQAMARRVSREAQVCAA